jgi:uroporphyrin-III C-methyltransferase
MSSVPDAARAGARGKVSLVGAGPGDPELLTLKAARVIGEATVLLIDDLVSDAIVERARADARCIHVGKRGGCKSTPQAFIEQLMLREAADFLRAHGIEVEVVNGITSGLAAATALGVPLTHRDHAHGVIFVTGHARGDAPGQAASVGSVHWPTLAAAAAQGLTLVIYMGVSEAARLQRGLMEALPGTTPVAIVERASQAGERRAVSTLGGLLSTIEREGLGSPAIIIVGDVVQGLGSLAATGLVGRAGTTRAA